MASRELLHCKSKYLSPRDTLHQTTVLEMRTQLEPPVVHISLFDREVRTGGRLGASAFTTEATNDNSESASARHTEVSCNADGGG